MRYTITLLHRPGRPVARTALFTAHRVAQAAAVGVLVWPALGAAQNAETLPAQRIEIRNTAEAQRRADIAGRQVVGREELLRHGDTRLVDALQRLPGVSAETRGQNTELKLGGLGTGYTQVLLNGEPLPRGVALDSIALDSIERVEIVRGSTVQSSQAIAGSINLITRRPAAQAPQSLQLSVASSAGRPQASATLNLGGSAAATTWGLGLVVSSEDQRWPATFEQERRVGNGDVLTQRTLTAKQEFDRTDAISLNPRLAWKRDTGPGGLWQFSTDHSLRYAESRGGVSDRREPLFGAPPAQQASELALNYTRLFWRGRVQASHRSPDGDQWEARLNLTHSSRDQQSRLQGLDFTARPVQDAVVTGEAVDQTAVVNLNHQRLLGEAHRLDLGAEWEQARRREDRVQTEVALPGGLPPQNLDERYNAHVQRWALYLQDDWTLSKNSALQLGLRLEQLTTESEGNVFDSVRQSHRLTGPVLRWSTKPGQGPGTFKLGVSRGFKLPAPRDVMPRRYVPIEVSATSPAQSGNPDLRPERAWSLDSSWHQPLPAMQGDWVLSGSLRRIDDVILDALSFRPQDPRATWLLQRVNAGRAWSTALEAEWRGQARDLLITGAPLRWQASLSLTRSRLDNVVADRPALVGQAPWQFKLSLTQMLAREWTAQVGLDARGAAVADQPDGRRLETLSSRSVSASLTWQPKAGQTWRLSVAQWGATDEVDVKTVRVIEAGGAVSYRAREAWQRDVVWRLGLDAKL
jgi:outer membrane receptor for ferrienterochelin and colicins